MTSVRRGPRETRKTRKVHGSFRELPEVAGGLPRPAEPPVRVCRLSAAFAASRAHARFMHCGRCPQSDGTFIHLTSIPCPPPRSRHISTKTSIACALRRTTGEVSGVRSFVASVSKRSDDEPKLFNVATNQPTPPKLWWCISVASALFRAGPNRPDEPRVLSGRGEARGSIDKVPARTVLGPAVGNKLIG